MVKSITINPYAADLVKTAASQAQCSDKGNAASQTPSDPQDTVSMRVSGEPLITDNERKCLNMISRESILKEVRDPAVLGLTAGAAGCLGLAAAMTGGPAFGVTVATALSGAILGAFASKGVSKALSEKKAWQKTFVQNPEAVSIEKLREPYLNVYLKATRNGLV